MEILRDLITGKPISEYEDEPIRQDAEARLLELGYSKEQVLVDAQRIVEVDGSPQTITADLLVLHQGRPALVLRCARGSLVTRENQVVAAARVISDPWAPLALVFNRDNAHLMDTAGGCLLETGLQAIPGPEKLGRLMERHPPQSPSPQQTIKAARVYLAMESLEGECSHRCEIQAELKALDDSGDEA